MHFPAPRTRNEEERILPLINVVFLLLIFFMLAGRLATREPFRIDPPRSASEGAVDSRGATVLVGADGRLAIDGRIVDDSALRAALVRLTGAGTPPRIRLKADGRVEATRAVAVMALLREAGVRNIDLLTVTARH